jgi:hypothetical protein
MKLAYNPKQAILMNAEYDIIVYGGARGGGKTFAVSGNKSILHVREEYTEEEMQELGIDPSGWRVTKRDGTKIFYKVSIDYPHYRCVIVRHLEMELLATVKVECDKVFPKFGGRWIGNMMKYVFPSGCEVLLKYCNDEKALDFFKSANFHMLIVEELTTFKEEWIEVMEGGIRSTDPILKAMKIYTTNPGGLGHSWVKKKFIDKCRPLPDGDPVMAKIDDIEIIYQPLKPNKPAKTKAGESIYFIPSLVFDNPYLVDNDKAYIKNLNAKNEILRKMWLLGDWTVFAGQFFDFFDYNIHVVEEEIFFGSCAEDKGDLIRKRMDFDWSHYRLFRSYDYGYGEGSAWSCGAYALHKYNGDIYKFAEIVLPKLTARQQAKMTNEYFLNVYNLKPEHFEREIADPKSFWSNLDQGAEFRTAWDEYKDEGIILVAGKNDRQQGAMAMLEALKINPDGSVRFRYLSNCWQSIEGIVNLPSDPKNPNDVDTHAFDHTYDSDRYFVMAINEEFREPDVESGKSWRDKIMEADALTEQGSGMWKVS